MNIKDTAPLAPALATLALAAPPVLIGAVIGLGLVWLFSDKEEAAPLATNENQILNLPAPAEVSAIEIPKEEVMAPAAPTPGHNPPAFEELNRKITRDDVAEALEYGERMVTRKEAVIALQEMGFRKTAAYKALLENGKFGSLLEFTPDGLIEWKG